MMVRRSVYLCFVLSLILFGSSPVYAQGPPGGGGGNAPIEQPVPVPETLTVEVDCAAGDKISNALEEPAVELTILVSGKCNENIIIDRGKVTLRGVPSATPAQIMGVETLIVPPHFGITVFITATDDIFVEDLIISGGRLWGVAVTGFGAGLPPRITNCSVEGNRGSGLAVFRGQVIVEDTVFSENGGAVLLVRYSSGFFFNCRLDATSSARTALSLSNYSSVIVGPNSSGPSPQGDLSFLGGSTSVRASDGSIVDIRGLNSDPVEIVGRMNLNSKSTIRLRNFIQEDLGSDQNSIGFDSILQTLPRSAHATLGRTRIHHSSYADLNGVLFDGDVSLDHFATANLEDTTLRFLDCSQGADAFCEDGDGSTEAYATSSCGQCPDRCGFGGPPDPGEDCDSTPGCSGNCTFVDCGNRFGDPGEQCDDGNLDDGDGCSSSCTNEVCGNGTVDFGEECDDGNTDDGDGCSSTCEDE